MSESLKKNRVIRLVEHLFSRPSFSFWIAPILLCISYFSWLIYDQFTTSHALLDSLQQTLSHILEYGVPLSFLAIGAALVLSTNGVDLSVSGTATLGGVLGGLLLIRFNVPSPVAFLLVLIFGALSGLLLGFVVARYVSPLISSWALGAMWFVVSLLICNYFSSGGSITSSGISGVQHSWVLFNSSYSFWRNLAIPIAVLVFLFGCLYRANIPRRACAVGANADSATYAGIRVKLVTTYVYVINGFLAAATGMIWAGTIQQASTTSWRGYELIAIAIAVLGGTDMSGGFLRLSSVLCAAFLWRFLEARLIAMSLAKLPSDQQQQVVNAGFAIIILFIALLLGYRRNRSLRTVLMQRGTGG